MKIYPLGGLAFEGYCRIAKFSTGLDSLLGQILFRSPVKVHTLSIFIR